MEYLDHTDYSKVTSQLIKELYNYWKSKCFKKHFPKFSDIQLNDIPNCKPYMEITEIYQCPLRIKYIYCGDELLRIEQDYKANVWLHELKVNAIKKLAEFNAFKQLIRERVPVFGTEETYWMTGDEYGYEYAYFPFSDSGDVITHCTMIGDYTQLKNHDIEIRDDYRSDASKNQ